MVSAKDEAAAAHEVALRATRRRMAVQVEVEEAICRVGNPVDRARLEEVFARYVDCHCDQISSLGAVRRADQKVMREILEDAA